MSLAGARASSSYQEAIQVLETLESPAVGFAKPSDYPTGGGTHLKVLIKQNNTLLYLLIRQAQQLRDFEEKVEQLKKRIEAKQELTPTELGDSISKLTDKLEQASISGKSLPTERKQGPIYVFKNPHTIFKEEYSRSSKQ